MKQIGGSFLLYIVLCLSVQNANCEMLWQDNFDGYTSGWTPSISGDGSKLYPWTADETYDPSDPSDNGGGMMITNYEPSTYPTNERTNANSWNGWVEYPLSTGTISIVPSGGVSDTPALRMRLVKHSGLSNEIGIHKWLGNTQYQELYIEYKVKFGSTGDDFWWNGSWTGGDPDGNIIWKFGRVWTGFNPTDYDKTGGQSQPVENTTPTDESNWRTGIWIFRWMATDWNTTKSSAFFDVSNFHAGLSCTPPSPTCDSQSPTRDPATGNIWDWANTTTSNGRVNVFANSGNGFDSDGSFSEVQTYHTIRMYFKNRTAPDIADGDCKIWIDGTEITSDASVSPPILASMSENTNDYGMNFVRFGDNYNNLTTNIPDDPGYMDVYIDDIKIATTEEDFDSTLWYLDVDGDGWPEGTTQQAESDPGPTWYELIELSGTTPDCNDADPAISPGATEICGNGVDEDCDGAPQACATVKGCFIKGGYSG